jgi:hypothetical protein
LLPRAGDTHAPGPFREATVNIDADPRRNQRHYTGTNPPPDLDEARDRHAYVKARLKAMNEKLAAGEGAYDPKPRSLPWELFAERTRKAKAAFERESGFLRLWIETHAEFQSTCEFDPDDPADLLDAAACTIYALSVGHEYDPYIARLMGAIQDYLKENSDVIPEG